MSKRGRPPKGDIAIWDPKGSTWVREDDPTFEATFPEKDPKKDSKNGSRGTGEAPALRGGALRGVAGDVPTLVEEATSTRALVGPVGGGAAGLSTHLGSWRSSLRRTLLGLREKWGVDPP